MTTPQWPSRIVPAQLSFLAIYNPSLGGESDESFREQLVFYYSRAAHEARVAARKQARNDSAGGDGLRAEENEKLRQIGLAQGMVDFARTFSNGAPVDSIETEKSRIVLHELEKGWWILASVDLTRLPSISQSVSKPGKGSNETAEKEVAVEYSSREVTPPALLIQELLQAHYIFGLHHGPSLDDLFVRSTREKFCTTLDRFWTRFARNWDVLLHGNPAADIFSGIKLASGGELGFGVGEEEWGSGEREVLEDLARRTDGLLDLVVSRFGDPASAEEDKQATQRDEVSLWLGSGTQPGASDGVIFGGIGAMQRHSLRNLSLWMRQIYTYGEQAYGVRDNPLRERRKRRRRNGPDEHVDDTEQDGNHNQKEEVPQQPQHVIETKDGDSKPNMRDSNAATNSQAGSTENGTISNPPNIPPPIVAVTSQERNLAESADESTNALGIPDTYMKYLTFGLSTLGKQKRPDNAERDSVASPAQSRSLNKRELSTQQTKDRENLTPLEQIDPIPDEEKLRAKRILQKRREDRGHFMIGLKGNLLELDELSAEEQDEFSEGSIGEDTDGSRIVLRTALIELIPAAKDEDSETEDSIPATGSGLEAFKHFHRVRVILYVHRPFMYCFLFENRTTSLQYTRFYKSLHRNLVPIHKPLLSSTSPTRVAQRIASSLESTSEEPDTASIKSSSTKTAAANTSPIYDLIYDPRRMTIHTSIPNISEPGTPAAEGIFPTFGSTTDTQLACWTRVEALNVHSQILSTLSNVENRPSELERTSKTSRGWWIVWIKVPPSPHYTSPPSQQQQQQQQQTSIQSPLPTPSSQTPYTISTKVPSESSHEEEGDLHRIAFLVRKASDAPAAPKQASTGSRAMSSMLEVMSLGMTASREDDSTGGAGSGWGPAALAGGIGIDARAYVEGLLSLNR